MSSDVSGSVRPRGLSPGQVLGLVAACDALPFVAVLIVARESASTLYPGLLLRIGLCLLVVFMYRRTRHRAWMGVYAAFLFLTSLTCIVASLGLLNPGEAGVSPVLLAWGLAYGIGGGAVTWAATWPREPA
jgi:hypothetical protein